MRRLVFSLILLSFVLGPVASAVGQARTHAVRPVRLIKLFDFEDTDDRGHKLGYGYALPRHWYAIGRDPLVRDPYFIKLPVHDDLVHKPGYPAYARVEYDRAQRNSGDFSLKLSGKGANAGAFLEVGSLAIIPGSDYGITAKVRTEKLRGANARLTAYFIDSTGKRIDASVAKSAPIQTDGEWAQASVHLEGEHTNAAHIGLQVELLQPRPQSGSPLGNQQLVFVDVAGDVWFDDIAVWQLPHVKVSSESPTNLHTGDAPPTFNLTMRDLTGRKLIAKATAYDHRLQPVDHIERGVGAGTPNQWQWQPKLTKRGWYLVDLQISESSGGTVVARTFGVAIWLGNEEPIFGADASRFKLVAEDVPPVEMRLLPQVMDRTGLSSVVVSVWDRETTQATLGDRVELLDQILVGIGGSGRTVTFSLHPVPTALAQIKGVSAAHPIGVLQTSPSLWLAYLQPFFRQHGQRVRRWQLGDAQQAEAFFYDDPDALISGILDEFESRVPRPRLLLPWRADQARRMKNSDPRIAYAMDVGPGISADGLSDYIAEWQQPPTTLCLYLREAPANEIDPQSRIDSLMLRMIAGWEKDIACLGITRPWTRAPERQNAILPDPLFGVFVNAAHRMAGREVVARDLYIGDGLRASVFDGSKGGMIVAWSESATGEAAVLRMVLGDQPIAIDVWGNRTPVPMVNGKHELRIGSTPVFIEGIDPHLARLRAGFHLDNNYIESQRIPHERELVLTNPYPVTINGRLNITGPPDWDSSPLRHIFSLSPGQTTRLPIVLNFPLTEVAGAKRLTAKLEFDADRHYEIDLSTPMELGLEDIDFTAAATVEQGPDGRRDAILTAAVTNKGDTARSFYLFALLPGAQREERMIPQLQPGESIVRHLRLNDIAPGALLRTGIRESNGPTMLNHKIELGDDFN